MVQKGGAYSLGPSLVLKTAEFLRTMHGLYGSLCKVLYFEACYRKLVISIGTTEIFTMNVVGLQRYSQKGSGLLLI